MKITKRDNAWIKHEIELSNKEVFLNLLRCAPLLQSVSAMMYR